MNQSFGHYIKTQKIGPYGSDEIKYKFIRWVKQQQTFPRGKVTWRQVRSYLIEQKLPDEMVETAHLYWINYCAVMIEKLDDRKEFYNE